jgi:antitoxin PrlF
LDLQIMRDRNLNSSTGVKRGRWRIQVDGGLAKRGISRSLACRNADLNNHEFESGRCVTSDAAMTNKGQTTLLKKIRDSLRMKTGDRMTFTLMPDSTVVMRVKRKSVMEPCRHGAQEKSQAGSCGAVVALRFVSLHTNLHVT